VTSTPLAAELAARGALLNKDMGRTTVSSDGATTPPAKQATATMSGALTADMVRAVDGLSLRLASRM
jgi:hypothetical protein